LTREKEERKGLYKQATRKKGRKGDRGSSKRLFEKGKEPLPAREGGSISSRGQQWEPLPSSSDKRERERLLLDLVKKEGGRGLLFSRKSRKEKGE